MIGFDRTLLSVRATLRDAMSSLESSAVGIVLLIDEHGRLTGVLTDGDIRRALLTDAALDDPLTAHMQTNYISVHARAGRAEVLELMHARRIAQVPAVDNEHRPVGIHLLHELLSPRHRPNWAVVMAGGQGTRLRPLTELVPKPMLRVAGRPILERIVLHLVGHGIDRIYISVNYLGHLIEQHFGDGTSFGCRIEYLREAKPLGTGGSLSLLRELPVEPILVMNGDLVTQADLGAMLDVHVSSRNDATVGVRRYIHAVPFGCVERVGDRVTALEEKPTIERTVNSGIYVLAPDLIETVPSDHAIGLPDVVAGALAAGRRIGTFEIEDDWLDVGQRDQLEQARGGGG